MIPKNILITGASGLIGTRLTELLLQAGHQVSHLGRSKKTGKVNSFVWDIKSNQLDRSALQGIDTIIHLAGAAVVDKRWTEARKKEILESRTKSTQLLFEELRRGDHQVKSFVSASAIGYYGLDHHDEVITETTSPGNDFLAEVTNQWETEVDKIKTLGLRVVKLRVGIVLSEKGGALKEMAKPVKFFVGSPLGSGQQYISWIHLDDVCRIFAMAVENEKLKGPYNATGPYAVTNRQLTKAIAVALHKPILLPPVPAFALKLILQERADLVLTGSNVSSKKIQDEGFQFQFTKLEEALADLFRK